MSLWLLNHFSTLTPAVVTVGDTVVPAVASSALLRRRYPSPAGGEHNDCALIDAGSSAADMVGVTLGMFGAIHGIILAFAIVRRRAGAGAAA